MCPYERDTPVILNPKHRTLGPGQEKVRAVEERASGAEQEVELLQETLALHRTRISKQVRGFRLGIEKDLPEYPL